MKLTEEDIKNLGIIVKAVDKELSPILNALKGLVSIQHRANQELQASSQPPKAPVIRQMSDEEVKEAKDAIQQGQKEETKAKTKVARKRSK